MSERKRIPARETIYNGIKMRSRTEALYAAALDRAGLEWQYEPSAFADASGQYLPDFLVVLADGRELYIEVKGVEEEIQPLLDKMQPILGSAPDAMLGVALQASAPYLALVMPGWRGIARWCEWDKDGVHVVGPCPIFDRDDEMWDSLGGVLEEDRINWEAMGALVSSFKYRLENLAPVDFDWTWPA